MLEVLSQHQAPLDPIVLVVSTQRHRRPEQPRLLNLLLHFLLLQRRTVLADCGSCLVAGTALLPAALVLLAACASCLVAASSAALACLVRTRAGAEGWVWEDGTRTGLLVWRRRKMHGRTCEGGGEDAEDKNLRGGRRGCGGCCAAPLAALPALAL